MTDDRGSVSLWVERLKAGEDDAARLLWERYFPRLAGLARRKLGEVARRVVDEEDVVQSAFHSFCQRARDGGFPELAGREELWRLLAVITARKATNELVRFRRLKRGPGASFEPPPGQDAAADLAAVAGEEPTPEFATQLVEQIELAMSALADPQLCVVALWKLEGRTNPEIARLLDCSLSAVERKVRHIRLRLERLLLPDASGASSETHERPS
ncbi:MAG: RNA polymerase subunit sigma-70 [Pirellulales bacterium]|nr:RNA polymerase subunit sigma-70 [Pirellulales bacterium]